ncbi:MAG: hypothetical protein QOH65_3467, partial [Methylobacteriaceae bacterium]|nr:hypothetical protein [Methylobacteriaceae bacterium]
NYYAKADDTTLAINDRVTVEAHGNVDFNAKGSFYFRSAYRNEADFLLSSLSRRGPIEAELRFRRMIETDAAVSQNYERLASQAMEDVFEKESGATTIAQFRERVVGDIRDSLARLFPDLLLNSLGNPLADATFRFNKGVSKKFSYKNLSGGEKAAFDLILDIVIKRASFSDAVYCIDEPEAHMNTRLQGKLLEELFTLVPEPSQLWIASHSIGMMRKARELSEAQPGTVVFLDFESHDFDQKTIITPTRPTRNFWTNVLKVALDDLAHLVAPSELVICEGNPNGAVPGKNAEHDAICYDIIFQGEMPDVKFIAGGNSKDILSDRLGFAKGFPMVVPGITVRRLIDRDDHAPGDMANFAKQGITTLSRRHLESYLYHDEVLVALCDKFGQATSAPALLADKAADITTTVASGKPSDDIKSAAGLIYVSAKKRLGLIGVGNDQMAFARNTLAPLITPDMKVYKELKKTIFS